MERVVGASEKVVKHAESKRKRSCAAVRDPLKGSRKSLRKASPPISSWRAIALSPDGWMPGGGIYRTASSEELRCLLRGTCEQLSEKQRHTREQRPSCAVRSTSVLVWDELWGRQGPNGSRKRNRRSIESSARLPFVKSRRPETWMLAPPAPPMTVRFAFLEPNCSALACSYPAFSPAGNCAYRAYVRGGNCVPPAGNGRLF
jgi:hypothetical protein